MSGSDARRLAIALDDHEHTIDVERGPLAGSFEVTIGDADGAPRTRSVRVLTGPPRALVLVDGRVLCLSLGGHRDERSLGRGPEMRRARCGPAGAALDARPSASAAGLLLAPMPGRIVAVCVQPGDAVEKGAQLLVIEAMKMQNELFCSGAGRVEAVLVAAGDTVERGAPLIRIA